MNFYDHDFFEIIYEQGKYICVLKEQIEMKNNNYDTRYGHCGWCGKRKCEKCLKWIDIQ